MSLLTPDVRVELSPEAWAIFARPINGDGGAQGCLRALRDCLTTDRVLLIDDALLARAYHYAYAYRSGGFQDRFRAVIAAACRAGWTPPDDAPAHPSKGAFGKSRA